MTDGKSDPPGRAVWFLQHMCPGDNEPLTGDLIEKFREGRTHGWFWRQVFIAFAVNIFVAIRRQWPYLCYAITGTAMLTFFWRAIERVPVLLRWARQLSSTEFIELPALAALPIFALALAIHREFRWPIVFRTGVINVVLIALGWWSLGVFDTIRSSLLSITYPHFIGLLTLPLSPPLVRVLFFSIFFVSAWLGRISPPRGTLSESRHEGRMKPHWRFYSWLARGDWHSCAVPGSTLQPAETLRQQ
jgi:hypothetical protein